MSAALWGFRFIFGKKKDPRKRIFFGAGDEARTRYLHLGKVALYRMSYTRILGPKSGASGRNRTNDTRIFSPLLYLLSYRGISFGKPSC